ncbi:MAG: DUF2784 domain-containing protein [Halomonadaceae bacterium]|uniref:DUF2784 domain-containing protein n=1 Tax=Halomonas colorata TaxID=2742615 RepID=A0ABR9FYL0_9GAMM|nr:DUF2784 domain-containing protein [Halomonas colorata]MBE0463715.1 DUF2784 domain-containing protein [Halomonas colorata]
MPPSLLLLLADTILVVHVLFVAFVVLGLLAIYAGYFLRWQWVRNKTFRILHLSAIGYVVMQSWLGVVCPLTTWEMALRAEAGTATYAGSFIQHWLQHLLYYTAPEWVFVVVYTLFGSLVAASWLVVRPNRRVR